MPSFDVVSEVDMQEMRNAIDQANREIDNRFDFKGVDASFELSDQMVTIKAQSDFQLTQMRDILNSKLTKRQIDVKTLDAKDPVVNLNDARQELTIKQGINKDDAKKLVKQIKETKLKVQASIQGDQVRVTGKKRDDLQDAIAALKEQKIEFPIQFVNFRD